MVRELTSISIVTLLSSLAKVVDNNVLLEWETVTELKNDQFIVEKPNNGLEFQKIGTVKGAGNSTSLLKYSFTDTELFGGIRYYRLKKIDFDGQFEHSSIIAVERMIDNFTVDVYPNPTSEKLTMRVNSALAEAQIDLMDITGGILLSKYFDFDEFNKELTFNVSDLPPGVYILRPVHVDYILEKRVIIR
jgi:hypothetical protein